MPLHSGGDDDFIQQAVLGSGSVKFRKRWIEFACQSGIHYGKWSTYEKGKRVRVEYIGRLEKVTALGEYAARRVREFVRNHNCHYVERFTKDLDECKIAGIEVESWHSGRGIGGLSNSGRHSGSQATEV